MDSRQRTSLDRYITGNYGENSVGHEGALSDECEDYLLSEDYYSEPVGYAEGQAQIRDCDGNAVIIVSTSIDLLDLQALVLHGRKQIQRGYQLGKSDMQAQFRALLDVPANPRNEE